MTLRPILLGAGLALAALTLHPAGAQAHWHGGWGFVAPAPVFVAPRVYVPPPPVFLPPPVVYAPPMGYGPAWVPPHWDGWGRWIPGHWR